MVNLIRRIKRANVSVLRSRELENEYKKEKLKRKLRHLAKVKARIQRKITSTGKKALTKLNYRINKPYTYGCVELKESKIASFIRRFKN